MRTLVHLVTAGLVALDGLVHVRLWQDGYRFLDDVGPLFLVNTVVAALLAVAVLAWPSRTVFAGVVGFSLASLGALVLSRTDGGFLGFTEQGWSSEARQALFAEVGAVVSAGALLVLSRPRSRRPAPG
jgi:hypothetical protein